VNLSTVAAHLIGLHNAIAMLNSRVKTLQKYLHVSQSGTLPRDHSLLRRVGELCHQLPAIDSPSFNTDFINVSFRTELVNCYFFYFFSFSHPGIQ
jgi:COP9 signalosome complex subunit 6